jgi:diguanylate cyclase (GGDEF)-like protein
MMQTRRRPRRYGSVRRALSSVALIAVAVILASGTSLTVGVVAAQPFDSGNGRFVVAGAVQAVVLVLIALSAYRVLLTATDDDATPHAHGTAALPATIPDAAAPAYLGRSTPGAEGRPAERLRFDAQLERALDAARSEDDLFGVVARAVEAITPLQPTELLLLGRMESTVVQSAETGPDGEGPGCPVSHPDRCEAMRSGRTQIYEDSDALDACPHLRDRVDGACSAVCVPVRVFARSIGVFHRTGDAGVAADADTVGYLESVSAKVGVRVGLLRANRGDREPVLDPVTGVLDRDSIEARILELARELTPFSLAQCDLDHFRDFARTYGRETADRAIRLVAQVLTEILRPGDLVGRFGDDEILVVLPGASNGDAQRALERAREHLTLTLAGLDIPPFTASFGVVESGFGTSLEDLLVAADVAVSLAKDLGRNRVVVAGDSMLDPHFGPE